MEGDGPSAGKPRDLGIIMAGADAVAVDACAARIIGLEPFDVLVTKEAFDMGLGEADPGKIEITGEDINNFIIRDFKLPQTAALRLVPKGLANAVAGMIKFKPFIDVNVCARCNLCKTTCPVNAIEIEKSFCRIDYKKCVKCLCCHEVCPYKAISIKRNILAKLVWG